MISNTRAVVLSRRRMGEADRLAVLYTEEWGKMPVRFVGAEKPKAKMKAISEPISSGEYRVHRSTRAPFAKSLGGSLENSFPLIRGDLRKTLSAFSLLELLSALSPWTAPNPGKFRLLLRALLALETSAPGDPAVAWIEISCAAGLLGLAGFEFSPPPEIRAEPFWGLITRCEFEPLAGLGENPRAAAALRLAIHNQAETVAERPLKAWAMSCAFWAKGSQGLGDRGWGIGKEIFEKPPSPPPLPPSPSPLTYSL